MFKFNFDEEPDDVEEIDKNICSVPKECKIISLECMNLNNCLTSETNAFALSNNKKIFFSKLSSLKSTDSTHNRSITLDSTTDLIPNEYEGGFKVWECTFDLIKYLDKCTFDFRNLDVLELGCGAGLPGILAFLLGANSVTFQDYNEEVINLFTIGNVLLNSNKEDLLNKCKFYSGSWESLSQIFYKNNRRFDLILTSETIYSPSSYSSLFNIFDKCLKDAGKIFLSAKSYYFGVGGGINEFKNFLSPKNVFSVENVFTHHEGVQREILLIKRIELVN